MSLVAKVEQLIAEEADGAVKALHAIAAHVEGLAPGAGDDLGLGAQMAELKGQVGDFIAGLGKQVADAHAAFAARLDAIEAEIAKLHGAPAQPAAAGGVGDQTIEQPAANVEQPQG